MLLKDAKRENPGAAHGRRFAFSRYAMADVSHFPRPAAARRFAFSRRVPCGDASAFRRVGSAFRAAQWDGALRIRAPRWPTLGVSRVPRWPTFRVFAPCAVWRRKRFSARRLCFLRRAMGRRFVFFASRDGRRFTLPASRGGATFRVFAPCAVWRRKHFSARRFCFSRRAMGRRFVFFASRDGRRFALPASRGAAFRVLLCTTAQTLSVCLYPPWEGGERGGWRFFAARMVRRSGSERFAPPGAPLFAMHMALDAKSAPWGAFGQWAIASTGVYSAWLPGSGALRTSSPGWTYSACWRFSPTSIQL